MTRKKFKGLDAPLPPRLLPISTVADLLGCCTKTVWRKIARGELPVVEISPRRRGIPQPAVERLIGGAA